MEETKVCLMCKEAKSLSEFNKQSSRGKLYYCSYCKECKKAYMREYKKNYDMRKKKEAIKAFLEEAQHDIGISNKTSFNR